MVPHYTSPHLAEHLKLHHQLNAGDRPHPHATVFTASGKVLLVRAEHYSIHLDSRNKTHKLHDIKNSLYSHKFI